MMVVMDVVIVVEVVVVVVVVVLVLVDAVVVVGMVVLVVDVLVVVVLVLVVVVVMMMAARPRSRVTTAQEDQQILQLVDGEANEIKRRLQLDASTTTIRKRIHEAGIHYRAPAQGEAAPSPSPTARPLREDQLRVPGCGKTDGPVTHNDPLEETVGH
ncbi:hypothetical protein E2C01_078777 [Portunus trituberculatus]|uniref:Transposase Tc1-like domain-containing protein n=1 Tax=Portunus trituberculatus TaxID=210409 RepID=A0A5B7IJQ6_PORTR|nr:hypothetical protein [Portunus trituberculatus]